MVVGEYLIKILAEGIFKSITQWHMYYHLVATHKRNDKSYDTKKTNEKE